MNFEHMFASNLADFLTLVNTYSARKVPDKEFIVERNFFSNTCK